MPPQSRHTWALPVIVGTAMAVLAGVVIAQTGPVAAMFNDDQRRETTLAMSFERVDLPAAGAATAPLQVYLSAGNLERAFDTAAFRPDAAIVPTNTDLQITASYPSTQRVLIDRVQKQSDLLHDLEQQIATRRKQPAAAARGDGGLLRIGVDTFTATLASRGTAGQSEGALPKSACLVATDFAAGGAVDRRELFAQDRVRQGIAACLASLDASGARSLVMPLMGAGSARTQDDPRFEGQRTLKECRLINSMAAIALGIHDFAPRRRNLREIGVLQWDKEMADMFQAPAGSRAARTAQMAYRMYAEQIQTAFRKGLKGQKTVSSDVGGNCGATLEGK